LPETVGESDRGPAHSLESRAIDLLKTTISMLGISAEIEARPGADPGALVLDVAGDSGGLLIGRRGATLDALEYILNRMLARDDDGNSGRVMIDVERYRERRTEYLDGLARRLADKARQTGHVVTLNPMSPRDRRIVHIALQEDQTVSTRSEGDGYFRRVLIMPAARPSRDRTPRERV
jgi:spoIIIJ-associated protein